MVTYAFMLFSQYVKSAIMAFWKCLLSSKIDTASPTLSIFTNFQALSRRFLAWTLPTPTTILVTWWHRVCFPYLVWPNINILSIPLLVLSSIAMGLYIWWLEMVSLPQLCNPLEFTKWELVLFMSFTSEATPPARGPEPVVNIQATTNTQLSLWTNFCFHKLFVYLVFHLLKHRRKKKTGKRLVHQQL